MILALRRNFVSCPNSAMSTTGLTVVVLLFIAAGQQGVWARELLNHFKRSGGVGGGSGSGSCSSSSIGCSTDKGNDVARLPLASGPLPVGPDNNDLATLAAANRKIGEGSAVGQGEIVGMVHSSSAAADVGSNSRAMVEKNVFPLTSAKEEHAARGFGYTLREQGVRDSGAVSKEGFDAKAIVGSAVPVKTVKEPIATDKRITEYDTNVPPYMIIVYHHYKKRSVGPVHGVDVMLPIQR